MKKRFLALFLCLCLLAGLASAVQVSAAGYVYPNDWSRDALIFAVENDILAGDENYDLQPESNITRAEMAAVLVRLLGATEKADLSSYKDVDKNEWYCSELSAAVGAGIFNGTSKNTMKPDSPITREQAMVVLCRSFGLVSEDTDSYQNFTDCDKVSSYAGESISALKSLGMAAGYTDGSIRPLDYITRAEVAQLLYNIFDCIADSPEEIPQKGFVIYRGEEALPEALTLEGTLIIGQSVNSSFTAKNWSISKGLILRTGKNTDAQLAGLKTQKLVCAPLSGKVTGHAEAVYLWGNGCGFTGDSTKLIQMDGSHRVNGSCKALTLRKGSLRLEGNTDTAILKKGSTLDFSGEADVITIAGRYVTLKGSGHAKRVVLHRAFSNITLAHDELDDSLYQAYWKDYDHALETVRTMRVPFTTRRSTGLFTAPNGERIKTLPEGTVVYNEWRPHSNWFYVSTQDGDYGWVYIPHCKYSATEPTTMGSLDYSTATKEGFINLSGYDSKTEYLVWVNLYTQKVLVFEGYRDNWELIKTFPCSSGAEAHPTPLGTYEIYYHGSGFRFDDYYVKYTTIFNGDHAFHTIPYNYDGSVNDPTLGQPRSHGCIRMRDEDALYIYALPKGTCVIIY